MGALPKTMAERADGGYEAKVVIVGDGAIGKTCLLKRMTTETDSDWAEFGENYEATTFGQQKLTWEDDEGSQFEIELWDTAGQEALESLRGMSYPGTHVIVVGYNCTDRQSLQNISFTWLPEFQDAVGDNCYIIMVGTKCDMVDAGNDDCVDTNSAQDKAVEIGAVDFIETSAKTCQGINDLKMMICCAIQNRADAKQNVDCLYVKPVADAPPAPAAAAPIKEKEAAKPVESEYHEELKKHHDENPAPKPAADPKPARESPRGAEKEPVSTGHVDEPAPDDPKSATASKVKNEDQNDGGGCKCTLM